MSEFKDYIPIIVSIASLVTSILAHRRASKAERRSQADARTSAYLTFRERFQQIKHELPPKWRDPSWLPQPDTDEWRRIELYWQNAFDEWFVPVRLNREHLEDLWQFFFESAVKSALQYRPLRYVAWALYEQGEFAQYKKEFADVLENLWGRPLRDLDFPPPKGLAELGAAPDTGGRI